MRQQGSEAAKKSTEQAAEQAAKEGSAVGVLKVMLKEHDHDNIQMVQLAAKPLLLHELKVNAIICLCRFILHPSVIHSSTCVFLPSQAFRVLNAFR